MKDPELTFCIFSFSRGIAKDFLKLIKFECEENELLRECYPDIIWGKPHKEAPIWSLNDGIVLKRKSNPREATVEAWGLVDSQPIGKHFSILLYDDVVTPGSVTTPDMINKTTSAWEMSLNLGKRGGYERYIGTRYHYSDTYKTMIDRKAVKIRLYPATENGKVDGDPVLMTKEQLAKKYREMGIYTFGSQMLLDPVADKSQGFKEEWLMYYNRHDFNLNPLNIYILCDPAGEKKKDKTNPDYTAILVIGLGPDDNYYLIDGVYDRLNLTERTQKIFHFHRKYKPIKVGYERFGKDSDISHIKSEMSKMGYNFNIIDIYDSLPKADRIKKLVPLFEMHRFFIPHSWKFKTSGDEIKDLTTLFIDNEYLSFPVSDHDDFLDGMSMILNEKLNAQFPLIPEYHGGTEDVESDFDVFS